MRFTLVSAFAPDVTQQIHSLRASGVTSFHVAFAPEEAETASRKSFGTVLWAGGFGDSFFMDEV